MIDYGDVAWDGFSTGIGMLWSAVTANPGVALLFAAVIAGALWLQLAPKRRRRR